MAILTLQKVLYCSVLVLFCLWTAWNGISSPPILTIRPPIPTIRPPIPTQVTGHLDVVIASTVNLSSWLSLGSRVCIKGEAETVKFRYMEVKLACESTADACPVWYWDVANWTIIYTKQNLLHAVTADKSWRFCPTPVLGERTERIIKADGKVEYNNCPDSRYPCAPWELYAAHWDKTLQQRVNRSPCCRKLDIDVMKHMGRVFDQHNITYLHVGGTVIGLVRDHGEYVPYDTDTDFGVDANDYEKLDKAIPDLQKTGYIFKWVYPEKEPKNTSQHWYMVGCANKNCGPGPG
ncbi:LicD [Desmophyllum pertusum]|uniref:LicD n=1 Tax=Desmophyllum pertusum TaxID=174260 RepID=A0A9W9YR56_9CNID|nr:LicD [Desmophyllum pertusum]